MPEQPEPTTRELAILKVLWDQDEASVRQVHDTLSRDLPIVQNTVQAFLRTMEAKGLVAHRTEGRTFIYRSLVPREGTSRHLLGRLLERVFDGAMDELVESALSLRQPTADELERLRRLVDAADADAGSESGDDAEAPSC